jgi:hypothetical protein
VAIFKTKQKELNDKEKIDAYRKEADSLNLDDLTQSLDLIIKANGDIVQSLYDAKPTLGIGEVYIESLLIKIIITSKSILQLSNGTNISTINHPNEIQLIDRTSLYILARSLIEAFLTLEYLYFNNLNREEQIFRYNLWRISGFQSRQNYSENMKIEFVKKLESEKKEIEKLKNEIQQTEYYSKLKKQDLWKLDNFGLPRVLSWSKLLENSILKSSLFSKVYGLYSNYAHSEFISVIQINEGNLGKSNEFNISSSINTLNIVRTLNCVSILLLTEKFDCAKEAYDKLDQNLKFTIEFWNKFARK